MLLYSDLSSNANVTHTLTIYGWTREDRIE